MTDLNVSFDRCNRPRRKGRRRTQRLQRLCRRWGISPIEIAFALPLIVLVLLGAMQAGGLTAVHKHMQRVANHVAAEVLAGRLTPDAARALAHERLAGMSLDYVVDVSATATDPLHASVRRVRVSIELPTAQVAGIDVLGLYRRHVLSASASLVGP